MLEDVKVWLLAWRRKNMLFFWCFLDIFVLSLHINGYTMKKAGFWHRVFDLYYDGFRSMTLGKVLWTVILIKLFIIFVVLKVFFFPDFLKENAREGEESDFVATELINRVEELKD